MVLQPLLNIQTIWMIFIKMLKNTIQMKKRKTLIVFDDMIGDMLNNKQLNSIVTELFIKITELFILLTACQLLTMMRISDNGPS